jgi:hypothetical protein
MHYSPYNDSGDTDTQHGTIRRFVGTDLTGQVKFGAKSMLSRLTLWVVLPSFWRDEPRAGAPHSEQGRVGARRQIHGRARLVEATGHHDDWPGYIEESFEHPEFASLLCGEPIYIRAMATSLLESAADHAATITRLGLSS